MKIKLIILFVIANLLYSCKEEENKKVAVIPDDPTLEQLNILVDKTPKDEKLLFERAKYFYKNEKYKEAIADMRNVLKIDSLNPIYYHSLSDIYMDAAQSRFAIKTMQDLIAIYPERIPSLLKLSELYFIVKQYDKSITTINSILYLSPDNPEAYFMLGVNFKEMKQLAKAKNSFLTAVENNPEHINAWLELGQLAEIQNDTTAVTYFKNAVLVAPQNIEALHYLAYYYQNNGNLPEALNTYRKISALNPNYTSAYFNSGIIYLKLDSIQQAFNNFNILVNIDRGNPKAYYFRGMSHYLGGNDEAAKMDFLQALKIYPEYEEAKTMLEKIGNKD